jgi:hypothetical protein
MIKTINYQETEYPHFQTIGNASQFAIPFAKHVCSGFGYDIGCMKSEWSFPGSTPIDLSFDDPWDANNLPEKILIISSPVTVLNMLMIGLRQ